MLTDITINYVLPISLTLLMGFIALLAFWTGNRRSF